MHRPLFSQKVKCQLCGKNHKGKLQRNKRVYICSSYDNFSSCKRLSVNEDDILFLVDRKFEKRLSSEDIRKEVKEVRVYEDKFEIEYSDGHVAISSNNKIEF